MIQATKKTKEKTYKAIRHSSSLKNVEHAGTWLYRIMLNEIFTFCKQRKSEPLDSVTEEPHSEDVYEDVDLKRALETLPDQDRMIGERLLLADLFKDGSDYIGKISDNIKEPMTLPFTSTRMEK